MESNKNYTPDNCISTSHQSNLAPVVVCVSGGADSVALLYKALFDSLDIQDGRGRAPISRDRIAVFHLNHCLRADESDADECYVREICEQFKLRSRIIRRAVEDESSAFGGNLENAGREIRYAEAQKYLAELCQEQDVDISAGRILTAHNANDRAESFIMNMMRGSSLSGLTSISRKRRQIVRPLLEYTHEELEEYLRERNIDWRIDQTNSDTTYLRSFVRYRILPVIKERVPDVPQKISAMCDILTDEDEYMSQQARVSFQDAVAESAQGCVSLRVDDLSKHHPAILRRVIVLAVSTVYPDIRLTSSHIKDVIAILDNELSSASLPEGIDVRIESGLLYFRLFQEVTLDPQVLLVPGSVKFGNWEIEAKRVKVSCDNVENYVRNCCIQGKRKVAFIDTCRLNDEEDSDIKLLIDTIHQGDTIQPYGMGGKLKLVSDILHEAKIPTHERSQVPLIKDANGASIMCVAGIRTDERYSCRQTTKEFIQLSFRKG